MSIQPTHHLVDVRSASEFSIGHLTSDIAPTLNIEYQQIASLPSIYAAQGITVDKNDHITLYCRSGRRSNIALQTLKGLGYEHVRDIGGFEDARRVLDREMVGRQLDEGFVEAERGKGAERTETRAVEGSKGEGRAKSFGALVEGLKALEE